MTNKQLLKYFEKRPQAECLYIVGTFVFVDESLAKKCAFAEQKEVEVKNRAAVEAAAALEPDELPETSNDETPVTEKSETQEEITDEEDETEELPATETQEVVSTDEESEELSPELAKEKLAAMELNTETDYYIMKSLVSVLEIPVEGKSREAYLAALLNYKAGMANG